MLGHLHCAVGFPVAATHSPVGFVVAASTSSEIIHPVLLLCLCVAAGIGTVLLLPGGGESPFRKIGGVVLAAVALILAALLVRVGAHAGGEQVGVYFWVFSAIALVAAIRVITHPRPVYAALYFVLTVFATAGLFILLWAEFMAAALIIIYAGAILVTYVFVIMLASQAGSETKMADQLAEYDAVSREPTVAAAVGFALMGVLLFVIFDRSAAPGRVPASAGSASAMSRVAESAGATQKLGYYLFENQALNLELAGLLLTVSMVGAIVIARRRVVDAKVAGDASARTPAPRATPIDDNPHSVPVYGTENPRQKAYPET